MVIDTLRKHCWSTRKYPRAAIFTQKQHGRIQINTKVCGRKYGKAFASVNGSYGYRRLHAVLKGFWYRVSEKVVRRLMKEEHLVVRTVKHRRYNSYLGEISPAAPNLIARDFHAEKPNEKRLTDITEFGFPAGKVYLSPIIDCFDGMAVAWAIGTSPNARVVNSMLDAAVS